MNTLRPSTLIITFPDMVTMSPHNNGRMGKCYLKCLQLDIIHYSRTCQLRCISANTSRPRIRSTISQHANSLMGLCCLRLILLPQLDIVRQTTRQRMRSQMAAPPPILGPLPRQRPSLRRQKASPPMPSSSAFLRFGPQRFVVLPCLLCFALYSTPFYSSSSPFSLLSSRDKWQRRTSA